MPTKALVLNQSYEPIAITTVEHAFCLVWVGKADLVDAYQQPIRSASDEFERPSVIRVRKSIRFNPFKIVELSRKNIFKRDNFKCAYCGDTSNLTVDHIVPKSRGGSNKWENLVTACNSCNNKKDNRTPEEAGLHLHIKPYRPHYVTFMSKHGVQENWKPYLYMV